MASLNTLRTKFGALLSVIIALALLAFILSLKTDMGFSDNDPKVGVIDGDKIRYSEYLNQYDAIKNRNGGVEASTDQESDQLAAATWQATPPPPPSSTSSLPTSSPGCGRATS